MSFNQFNASRMRSNLSFGNLRVDDSVYEFKAALDTYSETVSELGLREEVTIIDEAAEDEIVPSKSESQDPLAIDLDIVGNCRREDGGGNGGKEVLEDLEGQVLLGLMAQLDPARPEVAQAVATCRQAGIRPVMITGDHPLTARAIGSGIGLTDANGEVVLGRELEALDDGGLREVVARCSIYARVPPEQKLRIVKALQANGQVVAMTGDGVNDAPALKQAHIGVAMGITGTEVSKEAADMVLLDDNFATIVKAVEQGRLVYANIRRFVKYILGSNVGELITIAASPLLGLAGVPLSPLQILWMNLVTDGVPALALALEPGEKGLMQRPPAAPGESIFARGIGSYIIRIGVVFAVIVIALMVLAARAGLPWQTMVFTTLCLAQMGHALSARSDRPLIQMDPWSNPWLIWAVVLTSALQMLLLYVPWLAKFFGTTPLTLNELLICVGVSAVFFVYLELEKIWRLWRRSAHANA